MRSRAASARLPLTGDSDEIAVVNTTSTVISKELLRTVNAIQFSSMHLHALLDENERDSLTRLLNRKVLRRDLRSCRAESRCRQHLGRRGPRTPPPRARKVATGSGVIDIDHFKRVNDVHGHLIGDEVPILVAQLMKSTFRASDRLYRFGGEEFVVLLRCSDAQGAEAAFERFRDKVEKTPFPRVEHLTVSIGSPPSMPVTPRAAPSSGQTSRFITPRKMAAIWRCRTRP